MSARDAAPAYPLTRPLTSAEARELVAHPAAIHALIDAVKAALASMQQELIEREVSQGEPK